MRKLWPVIAIASLAFIAAGVILAQSKSAPAQSGDVFSSQGAGDDRRKYVSPDGRNFDRCAYETAHMAELPDSKQYGMPDHIPIDAAVMRLYARCAVDSCAVNQKAVCWGKRGRTAPPPAPTRPANDAGLTNCRKNSDSVTCDAPTLLPLWPAFCFAGEVLICEEPTARYMVKAGSKEMLKTGVRENVRKDPLQGGTQYGGPPLPAMRGGTDYYGVRLTVFLKRGRIPGQEVEGPVQMESSPQVYSRAQGTLDSPTSFTITQLWDMNGKAVLLQGRKPNGDIVPAERIPVIIGPR